jgi:hypothetical protein
MLAGRLKKLTELQENSSRTLNRSTGHCPVQFHTPKKILKLKMGRNLQKTPSLPHSKAVGLPLFKTLDDRRTERSQGSELTELKAHRTSKTKNYKN